MRSRRSSATEPPPARYRVAGASLGLALFIAPAPTPPEPVTPGWNPRAPENAQLLAAFTLANVAAVVAAIGGRAQRSGSDASKPALLVTFANGRKALVTLTACDSKAGTCRGLSIESFWSKTPSVPAPLTEQAVAKFNRRYAFAKAMVTADGRPSLQRYLTADYGFIRGNLAVNLLVFADQAERFATECLQPLARTAK